MKQNTFKCGLEIVTPEPIKDLFPCNGERISGTVKSTTRHWVPACQWNDDLKVVVEDNGLVRIGEFRSFMLPAGSTVEMVPVD